MNFISLNTNKRIRTAYLKYFRDDDKTLSGSKLRNTKQRNPTKTPRGGTQLFFPLFFIILKSYWPESGPLPLLIGWRCCQSEQCWDVLCSAALGLNQVKQIFWQEKKLMLDLFKPSEGPMKVRRRAKKICFCCFVKVDLFFALGLLF